MAAKEGFVHPELLIETDALERQLGDPALRVFDCTTNRIPDPDHLSGSTRTRRIREGAHRVVTPIPGGLCVHQPFCNR